MLWRWYSLLSNRLCSLCSCWASITGYLCLVLRLCVPLIFVLVSNPVYAFSQMLVIQVMAESHSEKIGDGVRFLETDNLNKELAWVLNPAIQKQFEINEKGAFSRGFSSYAYWFNFKVQYVPDGGQDEVLDLLGRKEMYLAIDYPPLGELDFYIKTDGESEYTHLASGHLYPFDVRPIPSRAHVFPFSIKPGETKEIYLRVHSASSIQIPMILWSPREYYDGEIAKNYREGIFLGIMLVMAAYNFFLYLMVRDKSYIFYILYILNFALFQTSIMGYNYQYFWPGEPGWESISTLLFLCIFLISVTQFTRLFLSTQKLIPSMDKVLKVFGAAYLFMFVANFFLPYSTTVRFLAPMALMLIFVLMAVGVISLRQGNKIARFFLLGWLFMMVMCGMQGLMIVGLLPNNYLFSNAAKIGSVIEVVLLSFALGDRMNAIQRQSDVIQKGVRRTLERSLDRLTENMNMKDEFLATVSHEFRTPLNGIIGSLELLSDANPDLHERNHFSNAKYSANNMMDLVEDVLEFTELQAGSLVLNIEKTPLKKCIENACQKYEKKAKGKGVEYEVEINIEENIVADIDGLQLALILKQIIGNGLKFTEKGFVNVKCTGTEDADGSYMLSIYVTDSGLGIEDKKIKAIFDTFSQVDSSDDRGYGGLGIGLAIVYRIVTLMKGTVEVESEVGRGSQFFVELPLTVEEDCQFYSETDLPMPEKSIAPSERNILIVEDNLVNQMVLKAMLQKLGYQVCTADHGAIALEMVKDEVPDLILMDCQMPVMDGIKATEKIRALGGVYCDIPIIAVTANAMSANRDRCLKVGMNEFLNKPVKKSQIIDALKVFL